VYKRVMMELISFHPAALTYPGAIARSHGLNIIIRNKSIFSCS